MRWANTLPLQTTKAKLSEGTTTHSNSGHWMINVRSVIWSSLRLGNLVFLCLEICPLEEKTSVLPNSLHIFNAISGTPTSTLVHGMTSSSSVVWRHLVDRVWGLALSFANSGWSPKLLTGHMPRPGEAEPKEQSRGTREKGKKEPCYFIADVLQGRRRAHIFF